MRRIVLLGKNGFIGSCLASHLSDPHFILVTPSKEKVNITKVNTLINFFYKGDIVINTAGYAKATDKTELGLRRFHDVNVQGVKNLAEACNQKGVSHLIHLSSVAAMGDIYSSNITEAIQGELNSPYAKSKSEGEHILTAYMQEFPITILRPTSVFGEGRGLIELLCKVLSKGKGFIPLPSGGKAYLPLTYVGNIVKAMELCINNESCYGETFIIGDENSYQLSNVIRLLARGLDLSARIINIPIPVARMIVSTSDYFTSSVQIPPLVDKKRLTTLTQSVHFSIAKFRDATGYQPPYSIDIAVHKVTEHYLSK